ncbi:hypothetical protein [Arthrobacter echini]|uniref:hypothetical protein n=1 Tax=Arthrobacter echini TaxID=1529066 RepID=UPI001FE9252D|nr:hypothetical protein [Arthrobacter echini]
MFMALTMGETSGLIMLAWMLNMYRNSTANVAVVAVSVLLLGTGIFLDRSQITDIKNNGEATTAQEAEAREVPDYEEAAECQCPAD